MGSKRILRSTRGATMVETCLQLSLVALLAVTSLEGIGINSRATFEKTEAGFQFTSDSTDGPPAYSRGGTSDNFGGPNDDPSGNGTAYANGGGSSGTTPGTSTSDGIGTDSVEEVEEGANGGDAGSFIP